MLRIWNFLLEKRALTYLLMTSLVLYGVYTVFTMQRESSPEIQIPVAVISTVLPGAAPQDVEELITNEVENAVGNVPNIKTLSSASREGVSVVTVEFQAQADLTTSIQKAKDEVDKIRGKLPTDAQAPVVTDVNFADQPVIIAAISSDLPVTAFKDFTDTVKDTAEAVPGVSRADISGVRGREVNVIVRKQALALYNLSLSDVIAGIAANNTALPAGTIEQNGIEYTIALKGDIKDPSEVATLPIVTRDGTMLYLQDIAFVSDGVEDSATISRVSVGGKPAAQAATITVYKQRGADITTITKTVHAALDDIQKENDGSVQTFVSYDAGDEIRNDLSDLTRTGLEAVILVMLVLFATLGWREALIAGLSIPLTLLISFIALKETGNTINFISLFSLILSIGILVDSAIVITEAIHVNLVHGMDKIAAAKRALAEYSYPLIAGTLTMVAVFVPLFTISGITGQFIKSIPFTIIFVLIASIFVALGLTPIIATLTLHASQSEFEKRQEIYAERLRVWYKRNIVKLLDYRKRKYQFVFALIGLLLISIALPIVGLTKVAFFPQSNVDYLYIELEAPPGTPLTRTDLATRAVEESLYDIPEIESFTTTVGAGSSFNQNASYGSRFASININLSKNRTRTSAEVLEELKEKTNVYKDVTVRVFEPSNGPPTGAPIKITLSGDDLTALKSTALAVERTLSDTPGAREVISSAQTDTAEYALTINRAQAASLGITPTQIAQTVRTAVYGIEATKIKKGNEEISVMVKVDLNSNFQTPHDTIKTNTDAIMNLPIQTQNGTVLLGSLVTIHLDVASDVISHEDQKRIVTVTSQLAPGAYAADVSNAFNTKAKTELHIPDGVTMKVGGENEDVDQSFKDMFRALILGIILILVVLIVEFNQYRQALFVLAVVPLSLIGVLLGIFITRQAVSFPTMLGFIALSGVVVNHAIILMDVFNRLRVEHPDMPIRQVVIEGGAVRLRPILLTKIASVIGLIPLLFADDLWKPIGVAMIFGLSFTGVLTLILLPALYLKWPGVPVRHAHDPLPAKKETA